MNRGILAANSFEAWVTRIIWFYMWVSTAVLIYVIWWYRAKPGSVIVHLFFISVKNKECILKIFIAFKATEDCWLQFSLLLTFNCVYVPNRPILSNRVGSPLLLRVHEVNFRCLSAMSVWFSEDKVWPILGEKKRDCNLPQTSRITYYTYIHFTDELQHPVVECAGDRQHQFLFFCRNKHDSPLQTW